jgi:hypothetical protein
MQSSKRSQFLEIFIEVFFPSRKRRSAVDVELDNWTNDEVHEVVHNLDSRDADEDVLEESQLDGDYKNKSKRHLFSPRKTYKHNSPPPPSYNAHQSSSYSNLPKVCLIFNFLNLMIRS